MLHHGAIRDWAAIEQLTELNNPLIHCVCVWNQLFRINVIRIWILFFSIFHGSWPSQYIFLVWLTPGLGLGLDQATLGPGLGLEPPLSRVQRTKGEGVPLFTTEASIYHHHIWWWYEDDIKVMMMVTKSRRKYKKTIYPEAWLLVLWRRGQLETGEGRAFCTVAHLAFDMT